jgi:hypothetical protein
MDGTITVLLVHASSAFWGRAVKIEPCLTATNTPAKSARAAIRQPPPDLGASNLRALPERLLERK